MKIKLTLRRSKMDKNNMAPLYITITHAGKSTMLYTGINIAPENWDQAQRQVTGGSMQRALNARISAIAAVIDNYVAQNIILSDRPVGNVDTVRNDIAQKLFPAKPRNKGVFVSRFQNFAMRKTGKTRKVYLHTLDRIEDFAGESFDRLSFEDITKSWLTDFDAFLARTSPSQNARNVHLRNIRAVFNDALDDEITTAYPFRKFKIRAVPTQKRNIPVDKLRKIFAHRSDLSTDQKYIDVFRLMFLLVGINMKDLFLLDEITDGRVQYNRAKTGKPYSIKVEPEADEIIAAYRGKEKLINIADTYKSHEDYLKRLNSALKRNFPEFPGISSYWARHSWATIARSIGVSVDDIALALGHGDGHDLTHIYLEDDLTKIDEANRRVIDWVLYGKK